MFQSKTGVFILDHELSFLMFERNFHAMRSYASVNPYYMSIAMDLPTRRAEELCVDALRSLTNFLMSAAALVDHYRVVTRTLSPEFKAEYDSRKNADFANDLLSLCVKKLRNYYTHKSMLGVSMSSAAPSGDYRLHIDVRDLRNWDGWNQSEMTYLRGMEDHVDAISLLEPYFSKTNAFYRWFMKRYLVECVAEREHESKLLYKLDG